MPSGNTNIMKDCRKQFSDIELFRDNDYINVDDIDVYIADNEWDIIPIESYYEKLCCQKDKCKKFIKELALVLRTNQLKDNSEYEEMINKAKNFIEDYKIQKKCLKKYYDKWNSKFY